MLRKLLYLIEIKNSEIDEYECILICATNYDEALYFVKEKINFSNKEIKITFLGKANSKIDYGIIKAV